MRGSLNTARGECRLSPFMARFAWLRFWCSPHAALRNPLPTRNVSTGAETVPDFAGAAEPIASLSSCPHILSPDLRNPFNAGPSSTSIADYKLLGCWQGTLEGKPFILEEFFSGELGGGSAGRY